MKPMQKETIYEVMKMNDQNEKELDETGILSVFRSL